jgi:hypothetical protein
MKLVKSVIDYKIYAQDVANGKAIEVVAKGKRASLLAHSRDNIELLYSPFSPKKTEDIIHTVKQNIGCIYE